MKTKAPNSAEQTDAVYTYNTADQQTSVQHADMQSINHSYDSQRGWLTSINHSGGKFSEGLSYFTNGNVKTQTVHNAGDGRILSKNRMNNNLTLTAVNGTNRISSVGLNGSNFSFAYDTKGSLTNDGLNNTLLGNYSFRNLPTTMNNFSYTYNDSGERIKKYNVDSLQTEYYLRDYLGRELVIYNYETNDPKQVNIYGNGLVGKIEIDSTENRSYYLKDHIGNVRCVLNSDGAVLNAQDYYPYGETIRQFNSSRYMLTEKERDNETNYDYFGARYYNSKLGVWLQVDPMSEKYPGLSAYNYTLGNPQRFIDPNGMQGDAENNGYDPLGYFMRTLRNLSNQMKILIWGSTSSYEQSNYGNEVGENYSKENVNNRLNEYLGQKSEQFAANIKKTSKKVTLKKVHTASSALSAATGVAAMTTIYDLRVSGGFLLASKFYGGIATGTSALQYVIEPNTENLNSFLIDAASQFTGIAGGFIRSKYLTSDQVEMLQTIYQSYNNIVGSTITGF